MSRNNQIIFSILGSLLLMACAWGLYQSIEFYEDTEKTQWSIEALRNPYLAAQQFLQASEIEVTEADSLLRLDSLEGVSTVLITDANQVGNPRQLEAVIAWLEKGGSLIVAANSFNTSDDLLLEKFMVDVDWPDFADTEVKEEQSIADSLREYNEKLDRGMTAEEIAAEEAEDDLLTRIEFDDDIGTLEISFSPNRVLSHPYIEDETQLEESDPRPFSWSSSEKGVHLLQFDVGEGLLTFISDPRIWQSRKIDQYDHAYLLWILSSTDGNFAILRPTYRDSLWTLISENAFESVFALGLLISLWLWHVGHRFGRVINIQIGERRALGEHFSATANYLWHRKASHSLLLPIRQEIYRRAHIAIPEFSRADADDRPNIIADFCGIGRHTVTQALLQSEFNEASFVHTVKILKHIEQSL